MYTVTRLQSLKWTLGICCQCVKNSTAVCGVYNMSRVCSAFPLISSRLSLRLIRSRPVRHLSQEFLSSVVITRFTCTSALTASLSRPVCVDSERLVPDATSSTNTTVTSRDAPTRLAVIFNVTYGRRQETERKGREVVSSNPFVWRQIRSL